MEIQKQSAANTMQAPPCCPTFTTGFSYGLGFALGIGMIAGVTAGILYTLKKGK